MRRKCWFHRTSVGHHSEHDDITPLDRPLISCQINYARLHFLFTQLTKIIYVLSHSSWRKCSCLTATGSRTVLRAEETTGKLTANGGDNRKPPAELGDCFTLREGALPSRGGGGLSAESGNTPQLLGVRGETRAPPQENTNTNSKIELQIVRVRIFKSAAGKSAKAPPAPPTVDHLFLTSASGAPAAARGSRRISELIYLLSSTEYVALTTGTGQRK